MAAIAITEAVAISATRMPTTARAEMHGNRPSSGSVKAAEIASGLGAVVLGMGMALVLPEQLRDHAGLFLVVGVGVHGVGMSLKYRLDMRSGTPRWWDRALFWGCWAALAGVGLWLALALLRA